MKWTAVVPSKLGLDSKSRLSEKLSPSARVGLSVHMLELVVKALRASGRIDQILLFSPIAPPAPVKLQWRKDRGRGLNEGLITLRREMADRAMLVIHGDVPRVEAADIDAIVLAAEQHGHALAADRHDLGTNAVAVMPGRAFTFAFGANSLARHRAFAPNAAVIRRPGLSNDVDTPHDLDLAIGAGFRMPD